MIDICVTHFGNKYSSKYIVNLENGISRNYSGDFNLIIKTDCPNGHWDKISFLECDKPRIIMDIDFVINGNLDDLINYKVAPNSLAAFPRWWRQGGCKINGGFYKVNPGSNILNIVDKFYSDPEFWIEHYGKLVGTPGMGEQNFIEDSVYYLDYLPGSWLGIHTEGSARYNKNILNKYYDSYGLPLMKQNKFNDSIKLIHFIYSDNMIEDKPQWIQDLWNTT
jgi:hypothetical protein